MRFWLRQARSNLFRAAKCSFNWDCFANCRYHFSFFRLGAVDEMATNERKKLNAIFRLSFYLFFRCALLVVDERTADDVISVDIAGARVTCEMGPVRRGSFWAWSGNWLIEKKALIRKQLCSLFVCLETNRTMWRRRNNSRRLSNDSFAMCGICSYLQLPIEFWIFSVIETRCDEWRLRNVPSHVSLRTKNPLRTNLTSCKPPPH